MSSSMNRLLSLLLLTWVVLIPACHPLPEQYTKLEPRIVDAVSGQSILIQVDYGEVTIMGFDDTNVAVDGQVLFKDELEYSIDTADEQILIKALSNQNSSNVPLRLVIRVPHQTQVKVETKNASVIAHDLQGDLVVDSIAGDITIERMTGRATLHSNRGKITVRKSSGIFSVVGNYGLLTLQDVSGEIAASTIMGDIAIGGLIQMGDSVRLETDHGAVFVNLKKDSTLSIQVRSTSGDVTCMLPGLTSTTRTCDGDLNAVGGSLSIRTVSGAVVLQLIP